MLPHREILSFDEIEGILDAVAGPLGLRGIRVTGGEPLVRGGIADLVRRLARLPGVDDLSMTTNALLLPRFAAELRAGGPAPGERQPRHPAPRALPAHLPRRRSGAGLCRDPGRRRRGPRTGEDQHGGDTRDQRRRDRGHGAAHDRPAAARAFHRVHAGRQLGPAAREELHPERRAARPDRRPVRSRRVARRAAGARAGALLAHPGRGRDGRLHQPALAALLRQLQPHPPHRGRLGAHLPADRPDRRRRQDALPRRRARRGAGRAVSRGDPPQAPLARSGAGRRRRTESTSAPCARSAVNGRGAGLRAVRRAPGRSRRRGRGPRVARAGP